MFSASSTTLSSTSVLKTWILNISAKVSIRDLAHSMKLPATSFSLKLARNQSAVCLITVKIEIASSLM
jgi:hypothetical protein